MELLEGNKLIADFMEVKNVFEFNFGDNIKALYIAEDKEGYIDYKKGIDFIDYYDWNKLMPVIDKIEQTDMSKYHYKWNDIDGGERCNFMCFEFDMRSLSKGYLAAVYMELSLDPCERVAGDMNDKVYPTRIEAVWNTVIEFIQYYNKEMKNQEMISIYDFLGKAGGSDLGMAVYEAFKNKYPEEKVGSRQVSNAKYTGNIDLYPRWFLEQYFAK